MVKRAAGPSTASAATAVATLALDAGVAGVVAARAKSTRPDARSVTTTPTRGPSEREAISGASSEVRPWLVGRAPAETAGVSTAAGAAIRTVATRGTCQSASRGGSSAATATPAPSANTLSIASAVTTVSRTRLATTGPLTRCLARNRKSQRCWGLLYPGCRAWRYTVTGPLGTGVNHLCAQGAT